MRVYVKPFVDWIWGGCVLMALGGLLAATDRRYRAARGAASEPTVTTRRRPRRRRMKSAWQFLVPLALFVVLRGFLAVGLKLNPREVPSPLIGKPAPAFTLTRLDDPARDDHARRPDGPGLDAERLGLVVRGLPRGAPAAGGLRQAQARCRCTA